MDTVKIDQEQIDGTIVNTVTGPNVDSSNPKHVVLPEFVLKSVYDNAIVNKANVDGSNTDGGYWFQDGVFSDVLTGNKQVFRIMPDSIIWGNIELDQHTFEVTSVSGLKVKVGSAEYTVFHTGNFNPDSKANTDGSNASGALAATIGNNHNHANKSIIDSITAHDLIDWDNASTQSHNALTLGANAVGMNLNTSTQVLQFANGYQLPTTIKLGEYDDAYLLRHSHSNKLVLDNLTQSVIDNSHTHGNKALLDSYNQTNANITDAVSLRHSHINKAILDAITAAYTTADKNTLDALAGIQLEADQANALIHIKDGNSVILSTLNVAFLNNEGTQFVYNPTTNTLDLINDYGQILSSIPVSSFVTNLVSNANWNGTTTSRLDFKDNAGTILFSINYTIANIQGLQGILDSKQSNLSHGLHTILNGNKVDVAFDVNTPVRDKNNAERLIFGNTQSTDVVIKGAVANGDFKIKDSTDADLFRFNGSNKVAYFPQLPAPQTGDAYLAMFDSGNGLWKHSTRISDLVTTSVLNAGLATKANVNGNNLTNITDWRNNLGVYSTTQVDGFLAGKANTAGKYLGLISGDSKQWNGQNYTNVELQAEPYYFLGYDAVNNTWKPTTSQYAAIGLNPYFSQRDGGNLTNIPNWQSVLGITTALNLNLQQVVDNGNTSNKALIIQGTTYAAGLILSSSNFEFYTPSFGAQKVLTGGLLASDSYSDASLIPTDGIYSKGTIATASHGTSADWYNAYLATQNLGNYLRLDGTSTMQSFIKFNNGWSSGGDVNVTSYYRFYNNGNAVVSFSPSGQIECYPAIYNNEAVTLGQLLSYNYATNTALGNKVDKAGDTMSGFLGFVGNTGVQLNSAQWGITYNSNYGGINFVRYGFTDGVFFIANNENVGVNTINPQYKFDVVGNGRFTDNLIIPNATAPNHAVAFGQLATYFQFPSGGNSGQYLNGLGQLVNLPTVGNGQLSFTAPTGLSISGTFNANQSANTVIPLNWQAGYQGFTTAESNKLAGIQAGSTVPNNGTFTVQGTGALTGSGSTSANASANTSATLDLNNQTKAEIAVGVDANNKFENFFGGVGQYAEYTNVSSGGFYPTTKAFFNVFNPLNVPTNVDVEDHFIHGARLVLQGVKGAGVVHYHGNFIDEMEQYQSSVSLENEKQEYMWDSYGAWRQVL